MKSHGNMRRRRASLTLEWHSRRPFPQPVDSLTPPGKSNAYRKTGRGELGEAEEEEEEENQGWVIAGEDNRKIWGGS